MKVMGINVILLLALSHVSITVCGPIFPFDYFYATSQPTTPESVISDYRHQKRTDSSFDHNNLVRNATEEMEAQYQESNAEFYAGVIGKLIGSVRSSFVNLFDDVRKRNRHFREESQRAETHKRKTEELNNSLGVIMRHLSRNLTESAAAEDDNETTMGEKRKRSDGFLNEAEHHDDDDKVGEREEIPIRYNALDTDYSTEDYFATTAAVSDYEYITSRDDNWFTRFYDNFKRQHRMKRARKIQKFLKLLLTPVLLLNETTGQGGELTSDIINDIQTLVQLTPLEIVRGLQRRESNDRLQLRMRSILKRIVYKYTRLYLIARRNFKKSHQSDQRDNFKLLNSISDDENEISDDEDIIMDADDDFEFSTSNGKSVRSVESLAILLLEIFGALYALGIGFWAHLEGGFFYDLLD